MKSGLEDAQTLQQLLSVLLKTLLSNNAEVAASQKVALTNFKDHAELEVAVVMSALATAAASSVSLQSQMVGEFESYEVTNQADFDLGTVNPSIDRTGRSTRALRESQYYPFSLSPTLLLTYLRDWRDL